MGNFARASEDINGTMVVKGKCVREGGDVHGCRAALDLGHMITRRLYATYPWTYPIPTLRESCAEDRK